MAENNSSETKSGIYVITSAQAIQSEKHAKRYRGDSSRGAPNKELIRGLERYCSDRGAEMIILRMPGMDNSEETMHPFFGGRSDVYDRFTKKLNEGIELSDMMVPPQNVDPASGRQRFVQTDCTKVFPHTKQRLKAVPASNANLPKLLMTTGVITHPNYHPSNHRGDAARRDHMYGAVVVEIIDDTFYNARHIRAQQNGKFIDMGLKYDKGRKPAWAGVEALVLGDIHVGDDDPETMKANYEMIDFFKPDRLFLHDFLNGHSVNPHERENLMSRAQNWEKGRLSLEEELSNAYDELCTISRLMGKREVNLVACNHHFFLDRYLESGDFTKEPWNTKIAMNLGLAMIDGEDPVEVGLRMMGDIPSNVNFLKIDTDYKRWGWQLGSHGHKGISGSRGSIRSRENAHGKSITGHSHTPEIQRNTFIVGTSTELVLDYNKGDVSSWMAANAVLYKGGLVQMIPIIQGKWKLKE